MSRRVLLIAGFALFVLLLVWMASGMFGEHGYRKASQIIDPMVDPYMPEGATEVRVLKELGGQYATYKISEADLKVHVAAEWERHRAGFAAKGRKGGWLEYSEEEVARALEGNPIDELVFRGPVQNLGWAPLKNPVMYSGPRKASAAGADYYYDREAGIAYHSAGYW